MVPLQNSNTFVTLLNICLFVTVQPILHHHSTTPRQIYEVTQGLSQSDILWHCAPPPRVFCALLENKNHIKCDVLYRGFINAKFCESLCTVSAIPYCNVCCPYNIEGLLLWPQYVMKYRCSISLDRFHTVYQECAFM